MFIWFAANPCKLNQFFISFNLILCVIVSLLAISPPVQEVNPKSGLAQAAMVTIYSTYLVASSITSEPADISNENICTPLDAAGKTQTTTIILGALFTFVALAYSTSRAATQGNILNPEESTALLGDEKISDRSTHLERAVESGAVSARDLEEDDNDQDGKYPADDEKDGCAYNYSFFHVIFVIAGMYLAMLLTNVSETFSNF